MVALAQPETGSWQGIRNQLFGQQRERDAEDGLLRVITQLQTSLALATGVTDGQLTIPAVRAQALRSVQDGLNALIVWHREQLGAARVLGGWNGPSPELGRDVLAAVQAFRPLFEGAELKAGTLDCRDVVQSVAQLRGPESDAFFNDALDGLVSMLQAVYVRIGIDSPTAPTALALRDLWEILLDELNALRCDEPETIEPAVELIEFTEVEAVPEEVVLMEEPLRFVAEVTELVRFRRLELVAC